MFLSPLYFILFTLYLLKRLGGAFGFSVPDDPNRSPNLSDLHKSKNALSCGEVAHVRRDVVCNCAKLRFR